jgi:Spherulation-specific family 4
VAYPNVSFTIVVNPFNGPGLEDLPDENYQREIPKLTCHPNVRVVGYVHTNWAKRDLNLVFADIEKYAQWRKHSGVEGLKVSGIFVDETPNIYDADAEAYLAKLRKHAKEMPGGDENVVRLRHYCHCFKHPSPTLS